MDYILSKYCPRIDFDSYEDFFENFKINVPDAFNFGFDVVDEWARVEPEKKALLWCNDEGEEREFTFTDISRLSNKTANAFAKLGIGKGDIVMCILRRRWEYWVVATALCKLGATIIPATLQLTTKDIVYRTGNTGVKMIVCVDDDYVAKQADGAEQQVESIKYKVVAGGKRDGWISFDELIEGESEEFERPTGKAGVTSKDIMLMYFTSGTTGNPKAVMHNFAHPLGHIITARYWQQVQENCLHMSVTDSGWAKFGWGKIYGQWICGAEIFCYDMLKFVPLKLLQKMQDYDLRTFCAPPTMYRFMLQEDVSTFDLSSIANFATAGEPLNAEVSIKWEKLTGKKIREGFGQTEGPVLLATFPWIDPKPGSMGKPSPLLNIRLLDGDGNEVEDGEEGAICVTRLREAYPPGLFVGYVNNAEATAEAVGGDEHCVIFGLTAEKVMDYYANGKYSAWEEYNNNESVRRVLDRLVDGTYGDFRSLFDYLLQNNDEFFILKDFDAYRKAHEEIMRRYRDREKWNRSMLLNIAASGRFSSDRTIEEYANDIWHLKPVTVK